MATRFVDERNVDFLLYEVFDVESLTRFDYYSQHNRKMFEMVVKAAVKLSKNMLFPLFEEMDRKAPELAGGEVKVHPSVKKIIKEFADGGWLTSTVPLDQDGEQLPAMVADLCEFIFAAANYSANAYAGLIRGAAHLIESFGSKELYDTYIPNMRGGKWQGTMALTEPEAGSSLADVATTAEPAEGGHYLVKGQKVFISAGDHDAVENVVHLMLAKIPGGPAGVKGISLFVVPKYRPGADGLEPNDLATSGIYHKLGYRGCPIAQLSMGDKNDCHGWLVGEAHQGLKYMFQMMNEARIGVGMGATAMACGAYHAALEYTRTRTQGRRPGQKDPASPPVPIIEHADIKRMLLFQKCVVEGSLSLLTLCSKYVDMTHVLDDSQEKEKYHLLLEILTPVAKSYPSEAGVLAISQGLQCLGGSGFCDDYPLEQYYRDGRIHPIHEGTTGIQGMDLLGRKVMMQNGRAFGLFIAEVEQTVADAQKYQPIAGFAGELQAALDRLKNVTAHQAGVAQSNGPEAFLADAVLYLEYFGLVTIAWQWLLQGMAAQKASEKGAKKKDKNFYTGKIFAMRYFFAYELPKIDGIERRLMADDWPTVEMQPDFF